MKRVLVLLAVLLVLVLVGCGGTNNQGGQQGTPPSVAKTPAPIELVESGYVVTKSLYVHYAVILKNPNEDVAVDFSRFRITARDKDGTVLATEDGVQSSIRPGQTYVHAFQAFSVDEIPATVDIEIMPAEDRDWINPNKLDIPELIPLTAEGVRLGNSRDRVTGEIINSNDFDIPNTVITVLFRDDSGKLIAGDTTYTGGIPKEGKIPFEIGLWGSNEFATSNLEVYAFPSRF